jgi:hypothetical protein
MNWPSASPVPGTSERLEQPGALQFDDSGEAAATSATST